MDLDSLWDFDDPAASEARFVTYLADPGLSTDGRAEALTQLARSQGLQRRYDEAHATLDRAASLGASGRAPVRLLLERGRVHRSSGDRLGALPLFVEASELAAKVHEAGLEMDALHMVALADDPAKSEEHHRHAIARAESSTEPSARKWLGSLKNNLGWTLMESGRADEALEVFQQALAHRVEAGKPGPIRIAEWTVARAFRAVGREEEALEVQRRLSQGEPDGYVFEELALLLEARDPDAARGHAARALELLAADVWFMENELGRVEHLRRLAQVQA